MSQEYMEVANIEQPLYRFWEDAERIKAKRKALKEALE
jgi:hypothetical protein